MPIGRHAKQKSKRLRDLRMNMGWSQADLAYQLGIRTDTVSRYERGERTIPEPTMRLAERISLDFWLQQEESY